MSKEVSAGSSLLDEKGRKLGRVVELIGPVRSPYASLALSTSKGQKSGDAVFINR